MEKSTAAHTRGCIQARKYTTIARILCTLRVICLSARVRYHDRAENMRVKIHYAEEK